VNLDNTLWLASFLTEATVVGFLIYRRVWKTFPVFCLYCVWLVFVDAAAYAVQRLFPASYFSFYLATTIVYSALELGVLVELTWSVLRPLGALLPRGALLVVAGFILGIGIAIWPFAVIPGFGYFPPQWHFLMRLEQTTSILRVVFFLVLAGCSQLLSIGWRDRELQIASGLGFYSLVGLGVAMLHTHMTTGSQLRFLNQVEVAGYLCSLMYWVFSFAAKEAERREFTPQMQSFLLALAGTARTTRVNFVDPPSRKPRGR
jgi:hypothetical protein